MKVFPFYSFLGALGLKTKHNTDDSGNVECETGTPSPSPEEKWEYAGQTFLDVPIRLALFLPPLFVFF